MTENATAGVDAGMIGANNCALATAEAPFGEAKRSGYGRDGSVEGLESHTYAKYVKIAPGARPGGVR
jgi:succinate-semialdehyde dehydrogenase / glutarate-semialdehyde dehydrogenase